MKKLNKKQRKTGISLIVLVITIIIMIILAAAIILSLNSSNVVSKANEAKVKNDWVSLQEKKSVMEAEIHLKKSTGEVEITPEVLGNFELSYNDTRDKVDTKYIEIIGEITKKALIPEGFRYVEGTISTGMVITDSVGNEFVWVPVDGYTLSGTPDTNGLYAEFKSVFQRKEWNNGLSISQSTEPYSAGYSGESQEYIKMMQSVQENNGFYIGRYEAGTTKQRTNISNGTTDLVVKKGAYVYNYVGWGQNMSSVIGNVTDYGNKNQGKGAVQLSKEMYAESTSVVSTLCYGVQWDATLQFMQDGEHSVLNSTLWGNYNNNTDRTSVNPNNPAKTGAHENWKSKNIYDMAGNVWEWTMEAYTAYNRVRRGGSYTFPGTTSASYRSNDSPSTRGASFLYGFRPTLYII